MGTSPQCYFRVGCGACGFDLVNAAASQAWLQHAISNPNDSCVRVPRKLDPYSGFTKPCPDLAPTTFDADGNAVPVLAPDQPLFDANGNQTGWGSFLYDPALPKVSGSVVLLPLSHTLSGAQEADGSARSRLDPDSKVRNGRREGCLKVAVIGSAAAQAFAIDQLNQTLIGAQQACGYCDTTEADIVRYCCFGDESEGYSGRRTLTDVRFTKPIEPLTDRDGIPEQIDGCSCIIEICYRAGDELLLTDELIESGPTDEVVECWEDCYTATVEIQVPTPRPRRTCNVRLDRRSDGRLVACPIDFDLAEYLADPTACNLNVLAVEGDDVECCPPEIDLDFVTGQWVWAQPDLAGEWDCSCPPKIRNRIVPNTDHVPPVIETVDGTVVTAPCSETTNWAGTAVQTRPDTPIGQPTDVSPTSPTAGVVCTNTNLPGWLSTAPIPQPDDEPYDPTRCVGFLELGNDGSAGLCFQSADWDGTMISSGGAPGPSAPLSDLGTFPPDHGWLVVGGIGSECVGVSQPPSPQGLLQPGMDLFVPVTLSNASTFTLQLDVDCLTPDIYLVDGAGNAKTIASVAIVTQNSLGTATIAPNFQNGVSATSNQPYQSPDPEKEFTMQVSWDVSAGGPCWILFDNLPAGFCMNNAQTSCTPKPGTVGACPQAWAGPNVGYTSTEVALTNADTFTLDLDVYNYSPTIYLVKADGSVLPVTTATAQGSAAPTNGNGGVAQVIANPSGSEFPLSVTWDVSGSSGPCWIQMHGWNEDMCVNNVRTSCTGGTSTTTGGSGGVLVSGCPNCVKTDPDCPSVPDPCWERPMIPDTRVCANMIQDPCWKVPMIIDTSQCAPQIPDPCWVPDPTNPDDTQGTIADPSWSAPMIPDPNATPTMIPDPSWEQPMIPDPNAVQPMIAGVVYLDPACDTIPDECQPTLTIPAGSGGPCATVTLNPNGSFDTIDPDTNDLENVQFVVACDPVCPEPIPLDACVDLTLNGGTLFWEPDGWTVDSNWPGEALPSQHTVCRVAANGTTTTNTADPVIVDEPRIVRVSDLTEDQCESGCAPAGLAPAPVDLESCWKCQSDTVRRFTHRFDVAQSLEYIGQVEIQNPSSYEIPTVQIAWYAAGDPADLGPLGNWDVWRCSDPVSISRLEKIPPNSSIIVSGCGPSGELILQCNGTNGSAAGLTDFTIPFAPPKFCRSTTIWPVVIIPDCIEGQDPNIEFSLQAVERFA